MTVEQLDAWFDQAARDLPPGGVANLFGTTLKNLSKRASLTLNKVTIIAIVDRVLRKSSQQYPLLENLKFNYEEIELDLSAKQFEKADPGELSNSFKFLFHELFNVLGNLTADIVTVPLPLTDESSLTLKDDQMATKKLEVLYEISKAFANFEGLDKSFAEVLKLLGTIYSFKTVVLHQDKSGICEVHSWQDAHADQESINRAIQTSRNYFDYLVTPLDTISHCTTQKYILPLCALNIEKLEESSRYIAMPLTLPTIKTFGILQFETQLTMSESDLRFISSIANLLAVTLDRYNKILESDQKKQTEISERTDELKQSHEYVLKLEKEKELREQFVVTLTHDLRTPLTAAKIGAQFILRRPENMDKVQQLAVKVIRSIDRMDQMIRDLLDANRIRAGEGLSLSMNFCDMKEIASTTLRELGTTFGERFILEAGRENFTGFWNEDGVRRVIENLATNAIKYGRSKAIIRVKLEQDEDKLSVTVHNDGNPIPEHEQAKLFQPFHRTNQAEKGGKKGWGLGLTLVRGVVEAHGGTIKVQSSEMAGTNFIFTLPKDARSHQLLN